MTRRNDVPEIFIEVELSIARSGSDQYFKAVKKFYLHVDKEWIGCTGMYHSGQERNVKDATEQSY